MIEEESAWVGLRRVSHMTVLSDVLQSKQTRAALQRAGLERRLQKNIGVEGREDTSL